MLPVDFRLDADGAVLLRTAAGSEPVRAVDGVVAAFGADAVDAVRHSGWSVVVAGPAAVVPDPTEHRCPTRAGPVSWPPSAREVLVRVEAGLVTGRFLYGVSPAVADGRRPPPGSGARDAGPAPAPVSAGPACRRARLPAGPDAQHAADPSADHHPVPWCGPRRRRPGRGTRADRPWSPVPGLRKM